MIIVISEHWIVFFLLIYSIQTTTSLMKKPFLCQYCVVISGLQRPSNFPLTRITENCQETILRQHVWQATTYQCSNLPHKRLALHYNCRWHFPLKLHTEGRVMQVWSAVCRLAESISMNHLSPFFTFMVLSGHEKDLVNGLNLCVYQFHI